MTRAYDGRMPELPVSARLSLWATSYFAGLCELDAALSRSAPDADHHHGARSWLEARRSLGERVALVALPRPGDPSDLPVGPAGADARAAAIEAGECLYVPGLGGALVPVVEEYGPAGDRGLAVRWSIHDSDPVPSHVLDAWSAREVERELLAAVQRATQELADAPTPWLSRGLAEHAAERLDAGRWGLPLGLAPRSVRVISLAGAVGELTTLGLEAPQDGTSAAAIESRARVLRDLRREGERALTRAVNVAALHLAGLRPGRED